MVGRIIKLYSGWIRNFHGRTDYEDSWKDGSRSGIMDKIKWIRKKTPGRKGVKVKPLKA